MMIYLLGAAGSGKTKFARYLTELNSRYVHKNVDEIMHQRDAALFNNAGDRWGQFWKLAKRIFRDIEREASHHPDHIYLVDVGAGVLEVDNIIKTGQAYRYFKNQPHVVVIDRSAPEAFQHASARPGGYWRGRSREDYLNTEYTPEMKRIYGLGKRLVVAGQAKRAAGRKLKQLIERKMSKAPTARLR